MLCVCGTCRLKNKNTKINKISLVSRFKSCPDCLNLELKAIFELLQVQFLEPHIYSVKDSFIVVLVGNSLIHILKQSLNIPLGKMKDMG